MTDYYKKFRAEKRCASCGKQDERTLAGRTYCKNCSQKAMYKRHRRIERARETMSCTRCGKQDKRTLSGKKNCFACAVKEAERARERYKKKKTAGAATPNGQ